MRRRALVQRLERVLRRELRDVLVIKPGDVRRYSTGRRDQCLFDDGAGREIANIDMLLATGPIVEVVNDMPHRRFFKAGPLFPVIDDHAV